MLVVMCPDVSVTGMSEFDFFIKIAKHCSLIYMLYHNKMFMDLQNDNTRHILHLMTRGSDAEVRYMQHYCKARPHFM